MKKIIKRENGTLKVGTENTEPSRAWKDAKDETDINNIIKKYLKTGQITHLAKRKGVYADLSTVGDYQDSLNKVLKAQNAFMQLPAQVRARFQNDPQSLITFLADDKNTEEAIKLGLVERPPTPPTESPAEPKK